MTTGGGGGAQGSPRDSRAPSPSFSLRAWRAFRRLRPEEALFVVGFVPSSIVTLYAYASRLGSGLSMERLEAGIARLVVATLLAATVPWIDRKRAALAKRPQLSSWVDAYRTLLPFALCIAVYTNLHDFVRYVNPHDIHGTLVAVEGWLFGGQPVVWAQDYITRGRTEVFSVFYASFFLIAPSTVLMIWLRGRREVAREALLGIILCFYTGYLLYVIFPAAPPRLYMESLGMFSVDLRGGPIMDFQSALIRMVPEDASRAAFPSLHAGVSLLSLVYAWRHARWYFPILLIVVIGLLLSTVYLRHHYVVDLIAGACLVPWILWLQPRVTRWWGRSA